MSYFLRALLALFVFVLGFLFFPLFFVGAMIGWSVFSDVRDEPAEQEREAELRRLKDAPVSVGEVRRLCESPAETAFLDAMVAAYELDAGPGALVGQGLRLRNQVGMGALKFRGNFSSWQYRADFLVDETLVVEIDGAAYHSSPEAVARDRRRDVDIRKEGYSVLRIPAKTVFRSPADAVKIVEDARNELQKVKRPGGAHPTEPAASSVPQNGDGLANPLAVGAKAIRSAGQLIDEVNEKSQKFYDINMITCYVETVLLDVEELVHAASTRAKLLMEFEKLKNDGNGDVRRKYFEDSILQIYGALGEQGVIENENSEAYKKAVKAMENTSIKGILSQNLRSQVEIHLEKVRAVHEEFFAEDLQISKGIDWSGCCELLSRELEDGLVGKKRAKILHPYFGFLEGVSVSFFP